MPSARGAARRRSSTRRTTCGSPSRGGSSTRAGGADAGRVGALGWARALPDGLDTPVGDGGHRLTQAAAADRIVVLGAGRVVEAGAHELVVGAGGRYAALWTAWAAARAG